MSYDNQSLGGFFCFNHDGCTVQEIYTCQYNNYSIIQSFYNNPDFKGLEKYVKVRMDFRIGTFGLVIYLVHSYINENKKNISTKGPFPMTIGSKTYIFWAANTPTFTYDVSPKSINFVTFFIINFGIFLKICCS